MDIQSIGAWGEFLGGIAGVVAAIGVVLTLLYLSRQIHQNTDQMRAQIAHGIMVALREQGESQKHAVEAEIYRRGEMGLDQLTDAERYLFSKISRGYFRVFEEAYFHHEVGRLEDVYWDILSGQFALALQVPGIRQDWDQMTGFSPEFKEFGNSLLNNQD